MRNGATRAAVEPGTRPRQHSRVLSWCASRNSGVYAATAAFCCACSMLAGLARCSWTGCCVSTIVVSAIRRDTAEQRLQRFAPGETGVRGMVFDWSVCSGMSEV